MNRNKKEAEKYLRRLFVYCHLWHQVVNGGMYAFNKMNIDAETAQVFRSFLFFVPPINGKGSFKC